MDGTFRPRGCGASVDHCSVSSASVKTWAVVSITRIHDSTQKKSRLPDCSLPSRLSALSAAERTRAGEGLRSPRKRNGYYSATRGMASHKKAWEAISQT